MSTSVLLEQGNQNIGTAYSGLAYSFTQPSVFGMVYTTLPIGVLLIT